MRITFEARGDVYEFSIDYQEYRDCLRYRNAKKIFECIAEIVVDKITDEWVQAHVIKKDKDISWWNFRVSQGYILEQLLIQALVNKLCSLYMMGFTEWKGREAVRRYEACKPCGGFVSLDYLSFTIEFEYVTWRLKPRPMRRHEVLIWRDLWRRRKYTCPRPEELPKELIEERFRYAFDLIEVINKHFPEYLYNFDLLAFQQWKEIRDFYLTFKRTEDLMAFLDRAGILKKLDKVVRYLPILENYKKEAVKDVGSRFRFVKNYLIYLASMYGIDWHVGIITKSLPFIDIDSKVLEAMYEIARVITLLNTVYNCRNFIISETWRGFHIIGLCLLHRRNWFELYRNLALLNCNIPREFIEEIARRVGVEPEMVRKAKCIWKYVDFYHAYYSLVREKSVLRVSTTKTRWIRLCAIIKDLDLIWFNSECPRELEAILRRTLARLKAR